MRTICRDRRSTARDNASARGMTNVSSDIDKLLAPKTLAQLEKLEIQIRTKLASNEPIDTDYWEQLLKSLLTYKAKGKLKAISKSIIDARLSGLRKQQALDAEALKLRLAAKPPIKPECQGTSDRHPLDPEPMLRLRPEDKSLPTLDASSFSQQLVSLDKDDTSPL